MDLICVGCERAERPKIILAKIFTMIFYHIAMQFAPAGRETNIFAKFANSSSSFIFSFRASDDDCFSIATKSNRSGREGGQPLKEH